MIRIMRLLGFGAIVLSISMTLHMHRNMSRNSASVAFLESEVVEVARRVDEASSTRQDPFKSRNQSMHSSYSFRVPMYANKQVKPEEDNKLSFQKGNSTHPRIAYMTYLHLNVTNRFEELIFPSLDTWHPHNEPYFVILAEMWRSRYNELIVSHVSFTKYQHRLHIVYVDCPEGKTPRAECCKQEDGMLYMLDHYDYDWLIYLDDDNYMRSTYVRDFLTNLSTTELMVLTSGPTPRLLGMYGYLPQKAKYKCCKDPSYSFAWGQVIAYNRATLARIHQGLKLHGLLKQCLEYNVYHDVGNALFHWMYRLPEIRLRISDRPNEMRSENMGAHGIGRCKRTGCPMEQIHDWYDKPHYKPPLPYQLEWRNASGYQTTPTFRNFGCPSSWVDEWHTMPIVDCLGPSAK